MFECDPPVLPAATRRTASFLLPPVCVRHLRGADHQAGDVRGPGDQARVGRRKIRLQIRRVGLGWGSWAMAASSGSRKKGLEGA